MPVQGAAGQVPRCPAQAGQAGKLPHDPASTDVARQARLNAAQAPRLGGLRQDAPGRARGGAGLPVALHAPRGHLQRAHRRHRRPGRASARSRRRQRRQAHRLDRRVQDFIARFLQHVLPPGFKRIRHYGLLSPAVKAKKLAAARAALAMPAANAQAREDAAAFLKRVAGIDIACCPHCKLGHWRTTEILPARRAPCGSTAQHRQLPGAAVIAQRTHLATIACCPQHGKGSARACRLTRRLLDHRNHRRSSAPRRRHSRTEPVPTCRECRSAAPARCPISLLSLTFPNSPAPTTVAAVQSNEVYPTPSASVRSTCFGGASDKRFPLGSGMLRISTYRTSLDHCRLWLSAKG
jgi:hypothetical protein